jgi:putative transposase
MKRKRHTPEQIIRKLRTAEKLLNQDQSVADVGRTLEVSAPTYHRWQQLYGSMKATEAKRLKAVEQENARLKRLLADAELDKARLKELAEGNFCVRNIAAGLLMVLQDRFRVSQRRACQLAGQNRNTQRRPVRLAADEEQKLRRRIRELARRHVRWGRRLVYRRLRHEGWSVNQKRV